MRNCSPWALLPPLYSLCTAAGLWVVYFVAVKNEMVAPLSSQYKNGSLYPPYISIAGNSTPASCIFGEVMNLAAFGGFVIAVLRYVQLKQRLDRPWLNFGSLVAFSTGSFGMTLIGNFQLFNEKTIHNLGTFLTFGLGTLFCWAQSYMTLRVNLRNEGRKAAVARFLLSGAITTSMVLYFSLMSQRLHMQAARCQWVLVMLFLVFLATFAMEFRHGRFSVACTDDSGRPLHAVQEPAGPTVGMLGPGIV